MSSSIIIVTGSEKSNTSRKKVDIAAFQNDQTFIRPVGQIAGFHYFSPKQQQSKQEPKQETTFQMLFQMELGEEPAEAAKMEQGQNFQMYV